MRTRSSLSFLSLLLFMGCSDSTDAESDAAPTMDAALPDVAISDGAVGTDVAIPSPDAGVDAAAPDMAVADAASPDLAFDAPPVSCDPAPNGGCADGPLQWFWNGFDCGQRADCEKTGYATFGECRGAHEACEGPGLCDTPPTFADPCLGPEGFIDGWMWDGTACVEGCDYLDLFSVMYTTEAECSFHQAECGIDRACGATVGVGCFTVSELEEAVFSDENRPDDCSFIGFTGERVFVAPDAAEYRVRITDVGGGAAVAVTPGACRAGEGATSACLDEGASVIIPQQALGVGSASDRAYTIRVGPRTGVGSMTVCIERVE
ncbi:MAG: hypothetical protein AAF411_04450 [Myxococcota bacterium]